MTDVAVSGQIGFYLTRITQTYRQACRLAQINEWEIVTRLLRFLRPKKRDRNDRWSDFKVGWFFLYKLHESLCG
jgi:hypothetical protein